MRRRGGQDEGGRDEEGACVEEAHEQLIRWSESRRPMRGHS